MALNSGQDAGQQCPAPFRMAAAQYYEMGMSVIPCKGVDGKIPAVRSWGVYQKKQASRRTLETWMENRAQCNVAIITGKVSGLTVIDSDEPETAISDLFAMFGETPVVVQTPSGGKHLYYRHNGETNHNHIQGRKIDVRGQGGYVIAPPSINPRIGVAYRFVIGDIWDMQELPTLRLPVYEKEERQRGKEGTRNDGLFKYLLSVAAEVDEQELEPMALWFNEAINNPPLPENEWRRTVKSVLRYKSENRLFEKGRQYIPLNPDLHKALWKQSADAVCLMSYLQAHHFQAGKVFAISPKGMHRSLGIHPTRIRKAIDALSRRGVIRRVYVGGKKPGDPHQYVWVQNLHPI